MTEGKPRPPTRQALERDHSNGRPVKVITVDGQRPDDQVAEETLLQACEELAAHLADYWVRRRMNSTLR